MEIREQMKRWRLILGEESQEQFDTMEGAEGAQLSEEQWLMDQALAAIYNKSSAGGFGSLKQLIFEPELLEQMEPDMNLATTILLLKDQVPKRSKESVREFMAKIVEEINKLLESDIRRAVTAAVNRRQHSPIPSAAALDFPTTIRRGIKNYNRELGKIIPEHYYFFDRTTKTAANKYTVILDVDQSGSMGESVIYSSIISCILASMAALQTRIVAFDTQVVDLTEKCEDPVDLLFGFQLGGGTDINRSIRYCRQFVENPRQSSASWRLRTAASLIMTPRWHNGLRRLGFPVLPAARRSCRCCWSGRLRGRI